MPAFDSPLPVDLTQDLRELARLAATEDTVQDLLRRGLDWLARIAPYDLATIFSSGIRNWSFARRGGGSRTNG